ncbi:hypothetical protein BGZ67_008378 [Mortierella alpina]|nr:hypothetical protein BGZ67_008378 [Mortierella alpina]
MYSEDEATKPLATTSTQASESQTAAVSPSTSSTATVSSGRNRNRNNSIHLQHNLSNLVQHQQRRRGSTYDLRRGSVSSLPSPTTPTTTGLMTLSGAPQSREERTGLWSLMPFLGSLGSSSNNSTLSHTSHRRLSSSMAPSRYLSTSVWFMLYGLPFSVAILFLAFILGQVETLWSKISCLIGSVICYMVCWAMVVAFLVPTHHAIHLPFSDELSAMGSATAASSMAMVGAATIATAVGATTAAAMEYEFDVVDAFTENASTTAAIATATTTAAAGESRTAAAACGRHPGIVRVHVLVDDARNLLAFTLVIIESVCAGFAESDDGSR